jgi:hypothetical protein
MPLSHCRSIAPAWPRTTGSKFDSDEVASRVLTEGTEWDECATPALTEDTTSSDASTSLRTTDLQYEFRHVGAPTAITPETIICPMVNKTDWMSSTMFSDDY